MQDKVYTYLTFVLFKDLENWSVSHLLGRSMGYTDKYTFVSIGDIIDKCQCQTTIKDDIQYKQITLKTNGGGAVLRGVKWGKDIGTKKQYIASNGQFIMSKIDARNGAFGIITEELDGAVVTSDFPLFNVDTTKIFPEYLALIASTKEFVKFAQSCSRGTTNRQRIDVNLFLSQQIPLPSLSEQKAIIEAYENKIQQAAMLEDQAKQVEHDIEDYLLSELGIQSKDYLMSDPSMSIASEPQVEYNASQKQGSDMPASYHWREEIKKEYKYLKFVRYKDIKRWDCYNGELAIFTKLKQSPYSLVEIGTKYDFIRRNWDKKESKFRYVEIGAVDSLIGIVTAEELSTSKAPSRATQKIATGDLIIGTTRPYLKKIAVVSDKYNDCVCSSGFQVIAPSEAYNLSFLHEYLKSTIAIAQFELFMSGALYPAITASDLKKVLIPLPPLKVQNAIVEHINRQKLQVIELKQQSETLRKEALVEFEKEIFE